MNTCLTALAEWSKAPQKGTSRRRRKLAQLEHVHESLRSAAVGARCYKEKQLAQRHYPRWHQAKSSTARALAIEVQQ